GSSGALGVVALVALLLVRRRRRLLALAVAIAAFPAVASAQSARPIDTELFHPAPGWDRYLSQEGAAPPGHLIVGFGGYLTYADAPLRVRDLAMPASTTTIISSQLGLDVTASLALWNRLLASVELPLRFQQSGGGTIESTAMGDLRLGAKVALAEARPAAS